MQSDGSVENRVEVIDSVDGSNENLKYSIDCSDPEQKGNSENSCEENEGTSSEVEFVDKEDASVAVISIVITRGDAYNQVSAVSEFEGGNDKTDATPSMKFGLPRTESYHEQCRVCQQQSEEPLMVLGCRCRGELAKAHRSCIDIWFRTRGSNKCEICQQVAANVPSPESQPSTSYWLWRVNPDFGGSSIAHGERERSTLGCVLDTYWRTPIGRADIYFPWRFCTACERYNRCYRCFGTGNCPSTCTGMLP
ncbi:uncharacterized protein LOC143885328 isoform X4 [Tasmannia lanceolata]|uniref:uncharacterized protein LOC143885328 isoform X4 n=1 Tax=Tasmannia lanceolata TaxID=3420 RepID=UPI0040634E3D